MTQTDYTNAIVNTMLGWLKTVASWFLRFFNLYSGASPIDFLVNNWFKLLIILLIIGIVIDLIVWLIRWRPHWVWFGKKRVVITDKNFFAREQYADDEKDGVRRGSYMHPEKDWVDNDFIVKSRRSKAGTAEKQAEPEKTDVFMDETFNIDARHRFADRYEDEVFNLEDLPESSAQSSAKTSETRKKKDRKAR